MAARAFGEEPLEPLSRRLLQVAGLLSVLLLAVLANSFLNSGEDSPEAPLALNPVASAAERVEKFEGGRMSLYVVYSSPILPRPLAASGSGAYNEETGRSSLTLNMKNPLTGQPMQMLQISDGDTDYEGGDIVAEALPPGKEWVRTEGEDESSLDFEESMELLDSPERFKFVGRDSINGKMTRHFRGEVKIEELIDWFREKGEDEKAEEYEEIQGSAPTEISAEGWIDGKSLLRRLRMVIPMPGEEGGPPMTIDMRMDFFDYGAKPDIQIPDPDSVVEGPLDEEGDAPSSASIS
ncbi:MAG TPA: hypothetical protein VF030_08115 [Solirubrobacterales bacterium]